MRAPGERAGVSPANENGVRKCDRFDCAHGADGGRAPAEYVVVLLLLPRDHGGMKPMRMRCGLVVCAAHREPVPDRFITNEDWQELLANFDRQGRARPHRILTEVDYVPIADDPDLDGYA